jgi:hypothetical protein
MPVEGGLLADSGIDVVEQRVIGENGMAVAQGLRLSSA